MSSNIEIKRICHFCNNEFIAKTTVTKFCSHNCSRNAWKQNRKNSNIARSDAETSKIINQPFVELSAKEYLSITEACKLIGVSRTTFWRVTKQKDFLIKNFGGRKIIFKRDLEKFFQ